jgi:hypothetical protein
MPKARAAGAALLFIALAAGCGKKGPDIVPVEGVIRLDGRPLKKVLVRFIPKSETSRDHVAVGMTDDSGRYTLTCKNKPGACTGEHYVVVTEGPLPPLPKDERGHPQAAGYFAELGGRPLPQKYANPIDSPLTVDVQAGRTQYDFDLTR